MNPFRLGELFGDGALGDQALTVAMAVSAGDGAVFIDHQCELLVYGVVDGTAPTRVEWEVQVSYDGGTTWAVIPPHTGVDESAARPHQWYGAGPFFSLIRLPHEVLARVRAMRVDGAADTTLRMTGTAREPSSAYDDSMVFERRPSAFDNGAGAAFALGAAVWTETNGVEWHPSGSATSMSLDIAVVLGGGCTALQARVRKRVSAVLVAEFMVLATNSVVGGVEDVDVHVVDLPLATGGYSLELPCRPGREYAVDIYQANDGNPTAQAWLDFSR